jgi:hypothetical protein
MEHEVGIMPVQTAIPGPRPLRHIFATHGLKAVNMMETIH